MIITYAETAIAKQAPTWIWRCGFSSENLRRLHQGKSLSHGFSLLYSKRYQPSLHSWPKDQMWSKAFDSSGRRRWFSSRNRIDWTISLMLTGGLINSFGKAAVNYMRTNPDRFIQTNHGWVEVWSSCCTSCIRCIKCNHSHKWISCAVFNIMKTFFKTFILGHSRLPLFSNPFSSSPGASIDS